MFIIVTKYLIPKGFRGLTIFPFVFAKNQMDLENEFFINHERIHLRQQLEMLVIPFFLWYLIEFLLRIVQFRNFDVAYLNISFEKEAYTKEKNLDYLNKRRFWGFLEFII
jgi:hypothetical protein